MEEKNIYNIVPVLQEQTNTKQKKRKKLSRGAKKAIIWSAVALVSAVVVAIGIVFGIPYYKKLTTPKYSLSAMPIIYITEGPALSTYNTETASESLIASSLFDKNSSNPYVIYDISNDGKSFYFIDELGDLYRTNLDLGSGNNFIAENVLGFMIDNSGNIVFSSSDGELFYCRFKKDRVTYTIETVDSGISAFKYSEEGNNIAYTKTEDGKNNLYKATVGRKIKTSLLYGDCGDFLSESTDDLSVVYTMKISDDGRRTVFKTTSLKKTEKIVENADMVYSAGTDGSVVYGIKTGTSVDLNTYFTDEKSTSDSEMTEPDYGEVLYGNISFSEFTALQNEWNAKLVRDEIREMLTDQSDNTSGYELYKYSNGKISSIDQNVTEVISFNEDNSVLIYKVSSVKTSGAEKICDISEFASSDEAFVKIVEILSTCKSSYKLSMEKLSATRNLYNIDYTLNPSVTVNSDYTGLYIYEKALDSETGTVKYIDFALGNVGTPTVVSEAATEAPILSGGRVLVTEKAEDSALTFFASGLKRTDLGTWISADTVSEGENGSYIYLKDMVENSGKLILNGESEKEIATDVIAYYYRTDSKIFYVKYVDSHGYVLYHYDGTKSKSIATNIMSVLSL